MADVTKIPFGERALDKGCDPDKVPAWVIEPVPIGRDWISQRWYIALVRPTRTVPRQKREDVRALEALQAMGIPAWFPTGRRRRRPDGRKVTGKFVNYLMFPGYLFVANEGDSRKFSRLLSCRHIDGMMGGVAGNISSLLRVPGWAMSALFAGEEQRQRRGALESEPLTSGESVSIVDGPFEQFDGEVAKLVNADTVEILLEILGRKACVKINIDSLARL